ncbi:short-chain fatty acid transporter [Gaetbulibacter aestuarii]|uniref:TIGR00366 family protein n=1 Tax=Gaetbulibacter aestuarii TaxID=1502358 RepID=A0ABW7MX75_9FLAO
MSITRFGEYITQLFKKFMPDAFVFALVLTIITFFSAWYFTDTSFIAIISSWYKGFWLLLEFGMQMVLMLVTGYSIALTPQVKKIFSKLSKFISTPRQVYIFIIVVGMILSLVSWGWMVITAVLARELAPRVKNVNYPFLIACVYFSGVIWVCGLSSTIPLLLNTQNNYLIEAGILSNTISTGFTLGSILNVIVLIVMVMGSVIIFPFFAPNGPELADLLINKDEKQELSIKEEAERMNLEVKALSDRMNNSFWLQFAIVLIGLIYIVYYFSTQGFDLNLNIMIFIFIILGLLLHKTPMRYGIAMKRSSSNISGILFQYPFYAGIMGIMIYTGLGESIGSWMASVATVQTYPIFAYLSGAVINFAIPSAGGEFAVIGPSIINAVTEIGAGLPQQEITEMVSRASLAVAYGESLTNLLQPFFLLIVLPVMGIGIRIQARDVLGYLLIPFTLFFILIGLLVTFAPL